MIDQQHRRRAQHLLTLERGLRLLQQSVGQARLQPASALQRLQQQTLQCSIEADHLHFVIAREPLLGNGAAQRYADHAGQLLRIVLHRRVFRQRFDNGAHIADRDALDQQVLQHLVQRRQGDNAWHQIFRQLRHLLADAIEQLLRLLTTKQLAGVLPNQMVKMRCHHGARLNHGKALNLRLLLQRAVDPDGRQTERRIDRCLARQRARRRAWVDRHPAARIGIAAADLDPFHQNAVARRRQLHVVADMHHRRQKADILRHLFTDAADTAQQLAVLGAVHHRDQAIADLHAQRVLQLHVGPRGFGIGWRVGRFHHRAAGGFRILLRLHLAAAHPPGQAEQRAGKQQKHEVRHAGHHAKQAKHAGAEQHDARVIEQLPHHLLADILIGADAGDDHARRG